MLTEAELIHRLGGSTVYQDFERAFCEVTQFSLRLLPIQNRSSACNGEWNGHQCSSTTDVPVRIGDRIIGLLQIGRSLLEAARAERFNDSEKPVNYDKAHSTHFHPVGCSRSRYQASALELFANQLSFFANEF